MTDLSDNKRLNCNQVDKIVQAYRDSNNPRNLTISSECNNFFPILQ